MNDQTRVLFVCSGNICRSPMAAAYLQHVVVERGLRGIFVDSAGTLGIDGAPPSREAVDVMGEIGVDLHGHASRGLEPADVRNHDVVIGMTREHLAAMASWPSAAERVLIRAFENGPETAADPPDLEDPIGRSVEFYREVRDVIVRCVDHLVARERPVAREEPK